MNRIKPNVFFCERTTKGEDQPAHPRSPLSAFVTRNMEGIVVNRAPCKISIV